MFKKPKKTDDQVIEVQDAESDSGHDDGFSDDVKKYNSSQPKKKKRVALSKTQRTVITVTSCVLVVLLAFGATVLLRPWWYFSNATAMTVNGTKVPVSEYNFNYWTTVQIFQQSYGNYFNKDLFDVTKDLSKQQCPPTVVGDEVMTWQDYFIQQTDTRIKTIIVAYQKAVEMNLALTASDQKGIESFFEITIKNNAAENEISEEEFIRYMFGSSCNKENLRTALEHIYIAERYNDYLFNSYTVDQTELDGWMTKYKDQFWGAYYHYCVFKATGTDEEAIRTAKKNAHDFLAKVTDQASFGTLAYATASDDEKSNYESASATLRYYFTADEISDSDISTWLFDESRQPGDKEVIYSVMNGAAYALYFLDANYPPTKASNLYSIYLGTGEKYATKGDAQAAAQTVQAKFIESGMTAEVFRTLANEYSDDPAAKDDGGMIENFLPKNMDQEVAIWCYTTGRTAGEYAIIESSYGGYYFVYLESWGDPVWQVTAIDDIKNYNYTLTMDKVLSDVQSKSTSLRAYMVSK